MASLRSGCTHGGDGTDTEGTDIEGTDTGRTDTEGAYTPNPGQRNFSRFLCIFVEPYYNFSALDNIIQNGTKMDKS